MSPRLTAKSRATGIWRSRNLAALGGCIISFWTHDRCLAHCGPSLYYHTHAEIGTEKINQCFKLCLNETQILLSQNTWQLDSKAGEPALTWAHSHVSWIFGKKIAQCLQQRIQRNSLGARKPPPRMVNFPPYRTRGWLAVTQRIPLDPPLQTLCNFFFKNKSMKHNVKHRYFHHPFLWTILCFFNRN